MIFCILSIPSPLFNHFSSPSSSLFLHTSWLIPYPSSLTHHSSPLISHLSFLTPHEEWGKKGEWGGARGDEDRDGMRNREERRGMREWGGGDVMKERCGMRVMEEGWGRRGEGGRVKKEGLRRGIRDESIDMLDRKEKGWGRIIREEG